MQPIFEAAFICCEVLMKPFVEYRNLEKQKDFDVFKEFLDSCSDVDDFINVVKCTGITINPYNSKHRYSKLVKQIDGYIKTIFPDSAVRKWQELLEESQLINSLYQSLYADENYQKTEQIPREEELSALLIGIEQILYYLTYSAQLSPDKLERLDTIFELEFINDNSISLVEKNIKLFDHFSMSVDDILHYILFYKNKETACKISEEISTSSIQNAFFHFVNIDRKNTFDDITKEWQLGCRDIFQIDDQIVSNYIEDFALDHFIYKHRRENRNISLINDLSLHVETDSNFSIPIDISDQTKEKYISDNEFYSYAILTKLLSVDSLDYFCSVTLKEQQVRLPLRDLLRSYAVIRVRATQFKEKQVISSSRVNKVCMYVDNHSLTVDLLSFGVPNQYIDDIIQLMTYSLGNDIFDSPLIPVNEGYILIPSIASSMDMAKVIMSVVKQFDFRGEAFEKDVLQLLKNHKIKSMQKKYTDESGEYQCDVIFSIGKELYICECKAWGEPQNIKAYYNALDKCYDAKKQLDRIARKYCEQIDEICKELQIKRNIRKINKIIITTIPVGRNNWIDDTAFIDFSCLSRFIERKCPSINMPFPEKKTIVSLKFSGFYEFEGNVTSNKLRKCLENPAQVVLMKKNTDVVKLSIALGDATISFERYSLRLPDMAFLNTSEYPEIQKYLNELELIYGLK